MPIVLQPSADLDDLMKEVLAARRKVVTVGVEMETSGLELDFYSHQHSRAAMDGAGSRGTAGGARSGLQERRQLCHHVPQSAWHLAGAL